MGKSRITDGIKSVFVEMEETCKHKNRKGKVGLVVSSN